MDARISWPQPEQICESYMRWSKAWETFNISSRRSMVNGDRKTDTPDSSKEVSDYAYKDDKQLSVTSSQVDSNHSLRRRKENKANTFALSNSITFSHLSNSSFIPWKPADKSYPNTLKGLHEEIIAFAEYMAPNASEQFMRELVIKKIQDVIQILWPNAKMEVFGSCRTSLYLPTSDVDIMIMISGNEWENPPLRLLERELIERGVSDQENVRVLDKASVPIVKVTDLETDVRVDISFNTRHNSVQYATKSASMIQEFLLEFPVLRPLVLVLKQFLLQRDLNEVYTGGISSYCLLLMVYSFLQLQRSDVYRSTTANLGELLIQFFEFYGHLFNYLKMAIRIGPPGCYIQKEELQKTMDNGHRPSLLCIQDPLQEGNDIGRSSYGVLTVKQAFENAYITLRNRLIPDDQRVDEQSSSILACIVRVTDEVVEYRQWIINKFEHRILTPQADITPSFIADDTETARGMWMGDDERSNASSSASMGGSSGAQSDVESEAAVEVVNTRSTRPPAVSAIATGSVNTISSATSTSVRQGNMNFHSTVQQPTVALGDQASKHSVRSEGRHKGTLSPRSDGNTRKHDTSSPQHKDSSSPSSASSVSGAHNNSDLALLPTVTDQLSRLSRHSKGDVTGHTSSNSASSPTASTSHTAHSQQPRTNTARQPHFLPQQQHHHHAHNNHRHHATNATSTMNGVGYNHESSAHSAQSSRSGAQHRSHSHAGSSSSGSLAVATTTSSIVNANSSFGASAQAAHSRPSQLSSHAPVTIATAAATVSSSLTVSVTSPSFPSLSGSMMASPSSSTVLATHPGGRATTSVSVNASSANASSSSVTLGTPAVSHSLAPAASASASAASVRPTGSSTVAASSANRRRRVTNSRETVRMNGHSGGYSSSSDTAR